jgi:hypothetical protein
VATDTFCVAVFSQQRVFGLLVMIEQNFFPTGFVVAGFALGTKGSLVFVVLLVTVVAELGRILEIIIQVTILAFRVLVLAQQIKFRFAVVEMSRFPVFFHMAVLAFGPQYAFMLIGFFVAAVAFGWSVTIFFRR